MQVHGSYTDQIKFIHEKKKKKTLETNAKPT